MFSLYYSAIGLEVSEISWIKSFQNIGLLIGFVPSGLLADFLGRIKIINVSALLIGLSFVIMYLFDSIVLLSIGEFVYGLGLSFNAGTLLSYVSAVSEELHGDIDERFIARRGTIVTTAALISGYIGSELFKYNVKYPLMFSVVGMFIYPFLMMLWMKLIGLKDNNSRTNHTNVGIKNVLSFCNNKLFILVTIICSVFSSGTQILLLFWSVYFVETLGFDLFSVYSIAMITGILGTETYVVLTKTQRFRHMSLSALILAISVMLIGLPISSFIKLIAFFVSEFFMGLMNGHLVVMQNEIIRFEEQKSTILSGMSFVVEIIVVATMMVNKLFLEQFNLDRMFMISGVVLLSLVVIINLYERKVK